MEHLRNGGVMAEENRAAQLYMSDLKRGKSLLQLMAIKAAMTADLYRQWSPGSFTSVMTPQGSFDPIVCTISYHFNKHGAPYGSISAYTSAALKYLRENRAKATLTEGKLKLPRGTYEIDGRILTFS
jgi:hypothetical protein